MEKCPIRLQWQSLHHKDAAGGDPSSWRNVRSGCNGSRCIIKMLPGEIPHHGEMSDPVAMAVVAS